MDTDIKDTDSRRPFSTAKIPTPPVGEKVPVIGTDHYMERFVRMASYKKPKSDGFTEAFRGQAKRRSIKFHCVGIEIGSRCHARPLWGDYVADAKTFVIILEPISSDKVASFYLNDMRIRRDAEQLLNEHDNAKNILIVFDSYSEDQKDTMTLLPAFQEWINELRQRHCVAHFPVCLRTGDGMDEALDWLVDHLSAPQLDTKKQSSALGWLAAVGKKALLLGTRRSG